MLKTKSLVLYEHWTSIETCLIACVYLLVVAFLPMVIFVFHCIRFLIHNEKFNCIFVLWHVRFWDIFISLQISTIFCCFSSFQYFFSFVKMKKKKGLFDVSFSDDQNLFIHSLSPDISVNVFSLNQIDVNRSLYCLLYPRKTRVFISINSQNDFEFSFHIFRRQICKFRREEKNVKLDFIDFKCSLFSTMWFSTYFASVDNEHVAIESKVKTEKIDCFIAEKISCKNAR